MSSKRASSSFFWVSYWPFSASTSLAMSSSPTASCHH
ncbi:secreted protein [marine sediment metagenome]|uniref:Secreted protein n=1 Tax=marine sediment metagenome TaxID=412755 RepID=A0A1B6NWS2_9ZZZZ